MGLRGTPYISSQEMASFLTLGCLATECGLSLSDVKNPQWHKRIKTATTNLEKVIDERVALLDKSQYLPVMRRKDHTAVMLVSKDNKRFIAENQTDIVQVSLDDIFEIGELALNSCTACEQGECVKECRFRKVFHRLSIPVLNENPQAGKCEFRIENEVINNEN